MSACGHCGSGVRAGEAETLPRIADALALGDMDRALSLGLLEWNGCEDCARAVGVSPERVAMLVAARTDRLRALAARERYRAREARLSRRAAERADRRAAAGRLPSALPAAAALALARAKARAQKP